MWVAVGGDRYRTWTTDGTTWDEQSGAVAGGDADLFRGIGWGNGYFVAVGGLIARSPDGMNWEDDLAALPGWMGGVAYGNDRWVAAGGNGRYMTSDDDAATWTLHEERLSAPTRVMTFGGGWFVGAGDSGFIAVSEDGQTWAEHPQAGSTGLSAAAYGAGLWVVNGRNFNGSGFDTNCFSSADASNWSPCSFVADRYEGTFATDGKLFIVHDAGYAFTEDGTTWTPSDVRVPPRAFRSDELWVGFGGGSRYSGNALDSLVEQSGLTSVRAGSLGFVVGR